jgi:hypothetical protein
MGFLATLDEMGAVRLSGLGILAAAAAAALLATASSAAPPLRGVSFISVCSFSHRGSDDPIVLPRQAGMSHDHTFVGNQSTDAFSTPASLRAAGTTCRRPADRAAYWAPTLFVGGDPVTPTTAIAYYRRLTVKPVRAFPPGLQIVAGNQKATVPQRLNVTWWDCSELAKAPRTANVPQCQDGQLSLHVDFPDCWDGKTLAFANQRNTRYSVNGVCPKTHPVGLPALSLVLRYPVTTTAKPVELASGGQFSGHADFINAWDQAELQRLVTRCLNAYRHCGVGG